MDKQGPLDPIPNPGDSEFEFQVVEGVPSLIVEHNPVAVDDYLSANGQVIWSMAVVKPGTIIAYLESRE